MIIDSSRIDFDQYLKDHSFAEAPSIKCVSEYMEEVIAYAERGGNTPHGPTLPWSPTHDYTRINDGKLSVWAGENGSGKSQMLGQVITGLMQQGRIAVIASMEMLPEDTLHRMINQSAGCEASAKYIRAWMGYFMGHLHIYDQLDKVATDRVLGMVHYAANELKAKDVVVDSLTKCGVGREDYTKQADFVDRLQWCARRYGIHIHLVCHMRKPNANDGGKQGKYDIRGAGEISDLADNVFVVKRNKTKEDAKIKQAHGGTLDANEAKAIEYPDGSIRVDKNRDFGRERKFGLWFDQQSGQFTESEGRLYPHLEVHHGS